MLVTAVAPIAWGSTYLVTAQHLPADVPLHGAAIRALPAGLLLLAITRRRPHGSWWWRSALLGAVNVGAFFALVYAAAQLLPSSVASTLTAAAPAVMLLLAWPLLGERPRLRPAAGTALGTTGVCLMLLTGVVPLSPAGVLASGAAVVLSSVGYVLTRRWTTAGRAAPVDVLSLTAWQLLAGGLLVLPVAVAVEGPLPALGAGEVVAFTYLTVVATALAFAAWFAGLRHLPAGTVGLVGLLNPVTGVLLGTALAGEVLSARQGLGVLLVVLGVVLGRPVGASAGGRRVAPAPGPHG